jgi:hypothetical protein
MFEKVNCRFLCGVWWWLLLLLLLLLLTWRHGFGVDVGYMGGWVYVVAFCWKGQPYVRHDLEA